MRERAGVAEGERARELGARKSDHRGPEEVDLPGVGGVAVEQVHGRDVVLVQHELVDEELGARPGDRRQVSEGAIGPLQIATDDPQRVGARHDGAVHGDEEVNGEEGGDCHANVEGIDSDAIGYEPRRTPRGCHHDGAQHVRDAKEKNRRGPHVEERGVEARAVPPSAGVGLSVQRSRRAQVVRCVGGDVMKSVRCDAGREGATESHGTGDERAQAVVGGQRGGCHE